jgi:hypothetical protein
MWSLPCFLVGLFASVRRNRSGFWWFVFSLLLSPVLGIIIVAILQPREQIYLTRFQS